MSVECAIASAEKESVDESKKDEVGLKETPVDAKSSSPSYVPQETAISESMSSPSSSNTSTTSSPNSMPTSVSSVGSLLIGSSTPGSTPNSLPSAASTPQNSNGEESSIVSPASAITRPRSDNCDSDKGNQMSENTSSQSDVISPSISHDDPPVTKENSSPIIPPISSPADDFSSPAGDGGCADNSTPTLPYSDPHTPFSPNHNEAASKLNKKDNQDGCGDDSFGDNNDKYEEILDKSSPSEPMPNTPIVKSVSPKMTAENITDGVNDLYNESNTGDKWQHPVNSTMNTSIMSPYANRTQTANANEPFNSGRDNHCYPIGENMGGYFYREGNPNPTPPYPTPPYPTPPYGNMSAATGTYSNGNNIYTNPCTGFSGAAGYPTPSTPSSGYTNPNTPSSSYPNPTTPNSSCGNPTTPNSAYHNPTTPNACYPNPTTPNSYPNPATPTNNPPCSTSSSNSSGMTLSVNNSLASTSPSSGIPYSQKSNNQNYTNPSTPGSSYPNPSTPGSSHQNPSTPSNFQNPSPNASGYQNPLTPGSNYPNPSPGSNYPNPSTPASSYPNPSTPGISYQNPGTPSSNYPNPTTPGSAYPNPTTPGSAYPNPTTPGSAYPNPTTPGSAYPNPTTPGSAYPNPTTPGSAYPNPTTPGSAYPNPTTPGSAYPNPTTPGSNYPNPSTSGSNYPNPSTSGSNYPNPSTSGSNYPNPSTSGSNYPNPTTSGASYPNPTTPGSSYPNPTTPGSSYSNPAAQGPSFQNSTGLSNFSNKNAPSSYCEGSSVPRSNFQNPALSISNCSNTSSENNVLKSSSVCSEFLTPTSSMPKTDKTSSVYDNSSFHNSSNLRLNYRESSSANAPPFYPTQTEDFPVKYEGYDNYGPMNSCRGNNLPYGSESAYMDCLPEKSKSYQSNKSMSGNESNFMMPNSYQAHGNEALEALSNMTNSQHGLDVQSMSNFLSNTMLNNLSQMNSGDMPMNDQFLQNERMMEGMLPHMNSMKGSNFDFSQHYMKQSMIDNMPPHMQNISANIFNDNLMNALSQMSSTMGANLDSWLASEGSDLQSQLSNSGMSSSANLQSNPLFHNPVNSMNYDGRTKSKKGARNDQPSSSALISSDNSMSIDPQMLYSKPQVSNPKPAESSTITPPDAIYYNITPDSYYNQSYNYLPEGTSINVEHRRMNCPCILCSFHQKNVTRVGVANVRNHISCVGRGRAGWFTKPNKYKLTMKVNPGLINSTGEQSSTPASLAESISSTISSVISNAISKSSLVETDSKPISSCLSSSMPLDSTTNSNLSAVNSISDKYSNQNYSNQPSFSSKATDKSDSNPPYQVLGDKQAFINDQPGNSSCTSKPLLGKEDLNLMCSIKSEVVDPSFSSSSLPESLPPITTTAPTPIPDTQSPPFNSASSPKQDLPSLIGEIKTEVKVETKVANYPKEILSGFDSKPIVACEKLDPKTLLIAKAEISSERKNKLSSDVSDQVYSFNDSSNESLPSSPSSTSKSKKRKISETLPVYKSEISSDPQSSGIKLKIKLALPRPAVVATKSPSYSYTAFSYQNNSFPKSDNSYLAASALNAAQYKPPQNRKRKLSTKETGGNRKKRKGGEDALAKYSSDAGKAEEIDESSYLQYPPSKWGDGLPCEILTKIFSYAIAEDNCIPTLLRFSRVSRQWRDVSRDPSLWHTADLSISQVKQRFRTEGYLLQLLQTRLSHVVDLNLGGWQDAVTGLILSTIGTLCFKLESLSLANCNKLHSDNIAIMLSNIPNLKRIDLSNIMGCHKPTPRGALGQQTLVDLFEHHNEKLTHITLAHNTISGLNVILNSLSTHCSNLQVLDMSRLETVGRDSLSINLEKLQEGCPLLRVLRLSLTKAKFNPATMTQQAASPGFPELEHLYLATDDRQHVGVNDLELERILKASTKLTLLDVRGCANISDSSLVRIRPWNIEHLYLSGGGSIKKYSDRLELVIRKWASSLQELDLAWTGDEDVVDTALFAVAEAANKLRVLNLCGSSCTVKSVRAVLKNCPDLGQINLSSCRALPRGIKRLYQNDEMITLRKQVKDEEERERREMEN